MNQDSGTEDVAETLRERVKRLVDKLPDMKDIMGRTRRQPFSDHELEQCVESAAVVAFRNVAVTEQLNIDSSDKTAEERIKEEVSKSDSLARLKTHFSSVRTREERFRDEKALIEEIELKTLRRRLRYRIYTALGIATVILLTSGTADYLGIPLPFMRMANPAAAMMP